MQLDQNAASVLSVSPLPQDYLSNPPLSELSFSKGDRKGVLMQGVLSLRSE